MHRHQRDERLLAIAMTLLAGYVDALGYQQLQGYFVSFMSGNSTRLSIGLATDHVAATIGGALVALFLAGVVLGTLAARAAGVRRPLVVLLVVALLLAVASLFAHAGRPHVAIACMTLAMGAENAAFERDGEVAIGLTYMTGTLVKTGQHLVAAFFGGDRWVWTWHLALWGGLVVGAALGAEAFEAFGLRALWFATVAAVVLAVVAWFVEDPRRADV